MAKPGDACLLCRKPFQSRGAGNWLCPACDRRNAGVSVNRVYDLRSRDGGRVLRKGLPA